ncbi:transmembrane protease serine 11D-like isoform X3 [Dermacentor andersoni]|uniref:transmembrane protease serine 11D-like isoform X3 n=1 Tax=Dermacentor andersoni TaxID=34620 RepID=UPI002415DFF7|nr:transmembrane protease serine 11D-like isoform X3 [Dermacentor andersoni]
MVLAAFHPFSFVAILRLLLFSFFAAEGPGLVWAYRISTCTLNSEICGKGFAMSRVLSGKFVQRDQQPWMVFLAMNFTTVVTYCSAVLLTEVHLLTAASCLYRNGTYPVWTKAYYMSTERLKGDFLYVDQVRLHTDYNATNHRNNIALLTVQRPVVFSRYTKPICIPTNPMNLTDMRITVSGWGRLGDAEPEQTSLYRGTLRGLDGDDCFHRFKNYGYDDLIMFCAVRDLNALCEGDAASPAMATGSDGLTYLLGLASYGFSCGSSDVPSVFLRIEAFVPWIYHKLNRFTEYTEIPTP